MAPSVAIVGAGPSGCALARLLLNSSINVTIFEGEESLSSRAQGGTLDLHEESGQRVLKECNLWSEFLEYARYDGEALALVDKNLQVYLKAPGTTKESSRGRPEIDRAKLREILVNCLPKSTVRWGRRVQSIEQREDGHYIIFFKKGYKPESGFDYIVGADGAWSRVRSLVSGAVPHYTGLGGFDLVIPNIAQASPELYELVNRGTIFSSSDGKGITLQQRGDGSLSCYTYGASSEQWMTESGFDVRDPKAVKEFLREYYKDWKSPLGTAPLLADDDLITPRNLYVLPAGHRWKHRNGVTCIADAAHLMSPFAGEGVNMALCDASELAKAMTDGFKASGNIDDHVSKFEERMCNRAEPIARLSQRQMEALFFAPGAPRTQVAGWVQRALGGKFFDAWWFRILVPQWFVGLVLKLIFRF